MSTMEETGPHFIEDGHRCLLMWEKDQVGIVDISCPNVGKTAVCNRLRNGVCVVQRFLGVYGLELNIGKVVIDGPIEIAWTAVAGESDLDREFAGLWIIPVSDPDYVLMKDETESDPG